MSRIWVFLKRKGNREILAWLGGGAIVVIGGLWSAFVYFGDPKKPDGGGGSEKPGNCSVSAGRDAKGNIITCGVQPATPATKP